jgi:SAM-dependent methyltransferase
VNRLSAYQSGTGSGVITADGCAVDVYALLPAGREPDVIHAALPPGAACLELGAGAGRVTRALLALGHPVTAVDESPEMLAHIAGARTVCASIEELDLGTRFAGVVLGSHLVNSPDAGQRAAFLAACARHVAPDGLVLVEQAPHSFFGGMYPQRIVQDGLTTQLRNIRYPRPDRLSMTIDYAYRGRLWSQRLTCQQFDMAELGAAGLELADHLTEDGAWFAARPSALFPTDDHHGE